MQDHYEAVRETSRYIADLIEHGLHLVITHGNGPQVGFIYGGRRAIITCPENLLEAFKGASGTTITR